MRLNWTDDVIAPPPIQLSEWQETNFHKWGCFFICGFALRFCVTKNVFFFWVFNSFSVGWGSQQINNVIHTQSHVYWHLSSHEVVLSCSQSHCFYSFEGNSCCLQMSLPLVKQTGDNLSHGIKIHEDLHWRCSLSPSATTLLHCFTAILTPTHQNGGMPQWTLGSAILPPIGTAVPQIPLSSKLKQAHQRACEQAAWRCDREGGSENERRENKGGEKKEKPHLRNPLTWQSLIQINIFEW